MMERSNCYGRKGGVEKGKERNIKKENRVQGEEDIGRKIRKEERQKGLAIRKGWKIKEKKITNGKG